MKRLNGYNVHVNRKWSGNTYQVLISSGVYWIFGMGLPLWEQREQSERKDSEFKGINYEAEGETSGDRSVRKKTVLFDDRLFSSQRLIGLWRPAQSIMIFSSARARRHSSCGSLAHLLLRSIYRLLLKNGLWWASTALSSSTAIKYCTKCWILNCL